MSERYSAIGWDPALLPVELWSLIGSYLPRKDLSRLSRSSRHLASEIRCILFRNVDLRLNEYFGIDTAKAPLTLLASDKRLAKCVVDLTLGRYPNGNHTPMSDWLQTQSIVNADALSNMTSLKSIHLKGMVLATAEEQRTFGTAVSTLPIEEFSYGHPRPDGFPGAFIEGITHLKKFSWGGDGHNLTQMWDLLTRSQDTIEDLSLPMSVTEEEHYRRLWGMRFPCLRSLTLGIWQFDCSPEFSDGESDFTDFILEHGKTLEHLDLEYGEYDEYRLSFEDDSLPRMNHSSLPRLRSFRGHTSAVTAMAKAGLTSLKTTLEDLTVGPGGVDNPFLEMDELFDAVLNPNIIGTLSSLKTLDLDLSQLEPHDSDYIAETIQRASVICGESLEVWKGTIPDIVDFSASDLGKMFCNFKKLRVLHLGKYTMQLPGVATDAEYVEYFKIVADRCLALEEVHFNGLSLATGRIWRIKRGNDGKVLEMLG